MIHRSPICAPLSSRLPTEPVSPPSRAALQPNNLLIMRTANGDISLTYRDHLVNSKVSCTCAILHISLRLKLHPVFPSPILKGSCLCTRGVGNQATRPRGDVLLEHQPAPATVSCNSFHGYSLLLPFRLHGHNRKRRSLPHAAGGVLHTLNLRLGPKELVRLTVLNTLAQPYLNVTVCAIVTKGLYH